MVEIVKPRVMNPYIHAKVIMAHEIPAFKELEEVHKHNNKLYDDKKQMKKLLNNGMFNIALCFTSHGEKILQYRTRINSPKMCIFTSCAKSCRERQCNW